MPTVIRADGLTNEFSLAQNQKKPPIKFTFVDGVAECSEAEAEALAPFMEANDFSFAPPAPPKAPEPPVEKPPAPKAAPAKKAAPKKAPPKAAPKALGKKPAAKKAPAKKAGK